MTAVQDDRRLRVRASAGPWPALILGADLVALLYTLFTKPYGTWGAFLLLPAMVLLTVPVFVRRATKDGDPKLARLLCIALAVKFAATLVRFYVTFSTDYHLDDASNYDQQGAGLAVQFRHLHFIADHTAGSSATRNMRTITGAVYALIGHTELGGYLVFSWLGFIGLYFCYRAFCVALPRFDRRRYARLVFFLPSLLFWPSAIGKDAWTLFTMGIATYGAARILARQHGGFSLLVLGMAGCTIVRPHISVVLFCGLMVASVLRRGHGVVGSARKWVAVVLMVMIGTVVIGKAKQFFGVEKVDSASVNQVFNNATTRSSVGHSSFAAAPVRNPLDLPRAAASVLFRPFPFEAHNTSNLIASFEGVFLMGLCVVSFGRLRRLPIFLFVEPYVAFVCVYSVLFIVAFSHIANFGILARQRTQLFPYVLALLALPSRKDVTWIHD